ncbi:MAG: hypothetical protein BWY35_02071 [Firmicutes bacterium ADurb.Bin248]|nr:MAG: hypothetical protein BWY35_02071 [Firmicutes bacterium ADurb.Bin248]
MSDDRNIKRKLRELKKLEIRLRFNGNAPPGRALVWDGFFGRGKDGRAAKYPPEALAALGREGFKRAVEAYFALVYYELYREAGISRAAGAYDPALLASLEEQGMTAGVNPPFRFSLGERSSLDAKKRNMEDFAKRFIVNQRA